MAISEQVVSTLIEAVAGLNARFNDLSKLMALPGPQGEPGPQGPQGERGAQGEAATDDQIKAAASEWLAANITQPKDGAPGRDPTEAEIALAVEIWFAANAARLRGPRGPAGPAGKDGADGAPGRDGRDGRDGSNGQDGIGVALIEQRDRNSFFITLTNGDEFEIELPEARVSGSFGGGGGIRSITSTDNTVIVTTEGNAVNLSVPGGGGGSGTVTSVGFTAPTGFSASGSPITTSGTIDLSFSSGYSLPTTAQQTNWDTAYSWGDHALAGYAMAGANSDITSLSGITGSIGTVDSIQFDTAATATGAVGNLLWNDTDGTLEFQLKGGNVTLQVGQEQVLRVTNQSGSTMVDGQAVYITGSTGNHVTVTLAQANSEATSSKTIAVVTETIANNNSGFATTSGLVRNLDTSALTEGAAVWLSPTVAGGLTTTKPQAPDNSVLIGWCVRQHATVGMIYVHIANGYEVDELHDVRITGAPVAGSLLIRNATDALWENATITAGTGVAITNADKSITITNSAPDQIVALTAGANVTITGSYPNFTIAAAGGGGGGAGTVTSVDVSGGTSGLTFSGGPITTAGAITLSGTLSAANGGTGASSLTGVVIGNGVSAFTTKANPSGAFVGTTDAQTLTSKRVVARVNAQATSASPWAWNSDAFDQQSFSALANALTINADAGTPTDGQKTMLRFKDNGTARALTWTTGVANSFRAIGVTLPTTTVAGKTTYVGCIYNAADSRWDVVAVTTEA